MKIYLLAIFSLVVLFAGTFTMSDASAHLANGHHSIAVVYQPTSTDNEEFKVTCKTNRDITEFPVFYMTVTSVPIENYDPSNIVDGELIYHSTDRDLNVKKNLMLEDGFYIQTVCNVDSVGNSGGGYLINTITSFDEIKDKKLKSNDYKLIPTITPVFDDPMNQEFVASCGPVNVDDSLKRFMMIVAYYHADKFGGDTWPFDGYNYERGFAFFSTDIDNRVTQNITLYEDTYVVLFCTGNDGIESVVSHAVVRDVPLS